MMNSPSSHAFFVGRYTRRAVCDEIKSKLCSVCIAWDKKNKGGENDLQRPPHHCLKNYDGKSGGMEPEAAAADMLKTLHETFHVSIDLICMDDDSSTRQAIRWNNEDYMMNNNTA
jgi:hypothetical protein